MRRSHAASGKQYPCLTERKISFGLTVSVADAVHVVTNEYGRYRIYSALRDGKWNWQMVAEFGKSAPPNYLDQAEYSEAAPALYRFNDTLFLSARTGAYQFDLLSKNFGTSPAESMYRAVTQPDGLVVASPRSSWIGMKPPRISRDGGKSWDEYHRLGSFGETPYVFANGDALAINASASFVLIGWKKNETIGVVLSHDKGKTSEVIGHVPYGCNQLETGISQDNLLFTRCFDGSLLHSVDRGKTWLTDFSRAVHVNAVPQEFVGRGIDSPEGSALRQDNHRRSPLLPGSKLPAIRVSWPAHHEGDWPFRRACD
jgi:hypothetical protein